MRIIKGLLLKYDGENEAIVLTRDGRFRRVKIYDLHPVGNEVYGVLSTVRKKFRFGLVTVVLLLFMAVAGSFFAPVSPGDCPIGDGNSFSVNGTPAWERNTGAAQAQREKRLTRARLPVAKSLLNLINSGSFLAGRYR